MSIEKNASRVRSAKPPRIVVVGSSVVDLTSFTDRFPRAGETIFGDRFDLGFGGKGANQAAAARLCGAEVEMISRVGDDIFGPATIANYKRLGIGCRHVSIERGVSSGVAPIFVESSGQNRILVIKGANDLLTPAGVDAAADVLKSADLILLQFEIPMRTIYHTIRFAKRHRIPCLLNPAPACPVDFRKIRQVDFFVPNETEAASLEEKPVNTIAQAKRCAEALVSRGFSRVLLTLGARGAILAGPDDLRRVPAFEVTSVDSSGAGDAFIGSFATFLAEGRDEMEAVSRASLYAALSTQKVGTQKSFLKRRAFEKEWKARV